MAFEKTCKRIIVVSAALFTSVCVAQAEDNTPKETYLHYRTALLSAKSIDDVRSMLSKRTNDEIESTPKEMKSMMFDVIKAMAPKTVQVLAEEVNADNATLTLTAKTEPDNAKVTEKTTGTVTLVKEGGSWKIDREKWNTKIEAR
ncbi:MAG TPA: hypothetical protein V6D17_20015 [Candidatus Obscuribacterales bacterium]